MILSPVNARVTDMLTTFPHMDDVWDDDSVERSTRRMFLPAEMDAAIEFVDDLRDSYELIHDHLCECDISRINSHWPLNALSIRDVATTLEEISTGRDLTEAVGDNISSSDTQAAISYTGSMAHVKLPTIVRVFEKFRDETS